MNYETITVRFIDMVCYIQFDRSEDQNTINEKMVDEFMHVLKLCEDTITVVVLEGMPEVFCFGVDFNAFRSEQVSRSIHQTAEPLYNVWLKLSTGPFVTIAHVRGKANAGGVGFVAACDIVISDNSAVFSLSELLFGIYPACVLPFLVRRVGYQNAHHMTLTTQPISAIQAKEIGLVDTFEDNSGPLLRKYLARLQRLTKLSISRYKEYMNGIQNIHVTAKSSALSANKEVFADPVVVNGIARYVQQGKFPWEA